MELRHLRYFVAVAEELHFGRAAERLRVAQPALSQQVRALEGELGVVLLARNRRRVALTEPGRLFLVEARRTLAQAAAAADVARRAAAGEVGRLRIGYVDVALWGRLPELVRAFRERHPRVAVTLLERLPGQQLAGLESGELDVGIGPPPPAGSALRTALVSDHSVVVALPAGHRLAARDRIDLAELATEPWVMIPPDIRSRLRDVVMLACAAEGIAPRVAQEARELDALVALVSAGLGVTLLPSVAEQVPRMGVVFRPLRTPALRLPLFAAWRETEAPPTVASFLEVLHAGAR